MRLTFIGGATKLDLLPRISGTIQMRCKIAFCTVEPVHWVSEVLANITDALVWIFNFSFNWRVSEDAEMFMVSVSHYRW